MKIAEPLPRPSFFPVVAPLRTLARGCAVAAATATMLFGCAEPVPGTDDGLAGSDETGDLEAGEVGPADDDDDDDDDESGGMSGDGEDGDDESGGDDDDDDDDAAETGDDDDDAAETGDDDDDDDDDDDPPPTCRELGNTCAPRADSEWQGPFAMMQQLADGSDPECPPDFPQLVDIDLFDDLVAPPAECECSCGEPVDVECAGGEMEISYTGFESGLPPNVPCAWPIAETVTLHEPGTAPAAIPGPTGWLGAIVEEPEVVAGSCDAFTEEEVADAQFVTRLALCGGESTDAPCDDEGDECLPTPDAPALGLCIYQEGEHECPSDYAERRVAFQGFTDARGCNDCECGPAEANCNPTLFVFSGPGGFILEVPTDGTCGTMPVDTTSVEYQVHPTQEECEPSAAESVGEAEPTLPVTICC